MTKNTTPKHSENAATARRKLLKTGGMLLAGLTTSAFAGRNGQVDKVTLYEDAKANEKPSIFSSFVGGGSAAAPAAEAAPRPGAPIRSSDVQILFIDVQPTVIAASQTVKPEALAASAGTLAKVARILNLPMTFAVVPEQGKRATLVPELARFANDSNTFSRQVVNPFMDQALVAKLAANRRKVLVIVGFSTEAAALQATQAAIAAGYSVQVPVDAVGSLSERTETVALRQMETAGAVSTSVPSVATLLAPDFSRQPGADVRAVLNGQPVADSGSGW